MNPLILIVEDETALVTLLRYNLEREGFRVAEARDGEEALLIAREQRPDLVLLDWMLPLVSGIEVCRQLRRMPETKGVPIIMLTARGEEGDKLRGLDSGADDYVTKPFSARELVLRIGSVLRRSRPPEPAAEVLVDGGLRVDPVARRAHLDGRELALTTREFDLLAYLMAHPGRAYTRAELLAEVWGWEFGDQSTVTVHVRRLREKIEADPTRPRRIATIWGTGYRYDPTDADPADG